MTADRSKTGPEPSKAQPGCANPNEPPASDAADGRNDDVSQPSMADSVAELSRRLGERAARQGAVDPAAAKAAHRAALEAYDQAHERRLIVGLSVAVAAVIGVGIVYLATTVGSGPVPPSPEAAARPEPASPPERTAAAPAPSSPSPAASVADTPAVALAAAQMEPAPMTGSQPAPVEPAPNQAALQRDEMREVQARLRSFGFNPGPVDGLPGLMTEDAVQHYQRHRGQRQTGTVDRDLLEQLRQDPARQIAQPAARPDARATRAPGPRRADPFEPVRAAGNRLGQWLRSLTR